MNEADLVAFRILCERVADKSFVILPEEYDGLSKMFSPLFGHCNNVAWAVREEFGGEIIHGEACSGILVWQPHTWNRLPNGREIDLTSKQFNGDGLNKSLKTRKSRVLSETALAEMKSDELIQSFMERLRAIRSNPAEGVSLEPDETIANEHGDC